MSWRLSIHVVLVVLEHPGNPFGSFSITHSSSPAQPGIGTLPDTVELLPSHTQQLRPVPSHLSAPLPKPPGVVYVHQAVAKNCLGEPSIQKTTTGLRGLPRCYCCAGAIDNPAALRPVTNLQGHCIATKVRILRGSLPP